MPATETANFACPRCGQPYDWKPEFAGRMAKCPCGHVLRLPPALATPGAQPPPLPGAQPPPLPGSNGSKNAAKPPPLPAKKSTASEAEIAGNSLAAVLAVSGIKTGVRRTPNEPPPTSDDELDPETEQELGVTGKYGETEEELKPSILRDRQVPIALLILGSLLVIGDAIRTSSGSGTTLAGAIAGAVVMTAVNLVLMMLGVLLAAKIAGINFGPVGTAIIKLCAIIVGPTTLGGLVTQLLGGDMAVAILGWGLSMVLYWALLAYLFRLDGMQTSICVMAIFVVRLAATMCIMGVLMGMLASTFSSAPMMEPAF